MKARLLHSLFILNLLIFAEFVLSDAPSKDIRALKEQSMMSVLYQQTSAERLAGSIQTFKTAKLAVNEMFRRQRYKVCMQNMVPNSKCTPWTQ